jgi:MoxR-like ATPase
MPDHWEYKPPEQLVQQVLQALTNGQNVFVQGLPGMGKSQLTRLLRV